MPGTYQYEPGNIAKYGKDRMRFELGDVMVEEKKKTCALCDEGIQCGTSRKDSNYKAMEKGKTPMS